MKWTNLMSVLIVLVSLALCVGKVDAAASLSDSLTSFDAGNFTTSATDPVVFDAAGAHFGSGVPGDDGRSYLRTIFSNYAEAQMVTVEVTFETTTDDQAVFIGIGAGERALFGTPDWSTQFSSASFWPETANDKFVRFKTANDINAFADSVVTGGLDPGTHRFRMTYTKSDGFLQGDIDKDYAGGPFVADATTFNFPIATSTNFTDTTTNLRTPDGWFNGLLSEPASIFIGGDDGTVFRDLTIAVIPEPATGLLSLVGLAVMAVSRRSIVLSQLRQL